jgi:hypothetical protein
MIMIGEHSHLFQFNNFFELRWRKARMVFFSPIRQNCLKIEGVASDVGLSSRVLYNGQQIENSWENPIFAKLVELFFFDN